MLFFLNKWQLYKKRQQRRCFSWRKNSDLEHFLSFDLKVTTLDDPQVHPLCGFQHFEIVGLFHSILKITCEPLSAWTNWVRMFQIDEFNLMSGMLSFQWAKETAIYYSEQYDVLKKQWHFLSEIDVNIFLKKFFGAPQNNNSFSMVWAAKKTHRRTRYLATFHFITATLMACVLSFWEGMAWMIRSLPNDLVKMTWTCELKRWNSHFFFDFFGEKMHHFLW